MKKIICIICVMCCCMTYPEVSASTKPKGSVAATVQQIKEKSEEIASRVVGYTKEKMAAALKNAATISDTKVSVATQQELGGEKSTNAFILFTNMISKEAFPKEIDNLSSLNDNASTKLMSSIGNVKESHEERENAIVVYTMLKMIRSYLPTLIDSTKKIHDLSADILTSKKADKKFKNNVNDLSRNLKEILDPLSMIETMNAISKIVLKNNIQIKNQATREVMAKMLSCFGQRDTAILGRKSEGLKANAVNLNVAVKSIKEAEITAKEEHITEILDAMDLKRFDCISLFVNMVEATLKFVLEGSEENKNTLQKLTLN